MQNLFGDEELLPPDQGIPVNKHPREVPLPPEEDDLEEILFGEEIPPGEKRRYSDPGSKIPSLSDPPPGYSPPPSYKPKRDEETNDLSSLEKFVKQNKNNPDAIIKTKKSKFYNWDMEEVNYKIREIYTERAKKYLADKTSIGQKSLGPYEGKSRKEMENMIKNFEEGMGGSGISRLFLAMGSYFAGNTSLKLKKEIQSLADQLFKSGIISKEQRKKTSSLK